MFRLADAAGLSVYTDADGPRSAAFYRKLGFERGMGSGHQLARHPPVPDLLEEEGYPAPGRPAP